MSVAKIGEFLGRDMLCVVDELRERIVNGEVFSLAIIAEGGRPHEPNVVLRGRYNSDPYRALVAFQRASRRLHLRLDNR